MYDGEIHTFEHLFAVTSREFFDDVIDFSPMGCRTGFYFTLFGDYTEQDILEKLCEVMKKIIYWDKDIPATTKEECGNYTDHSLYGAKKIAYQWLAGIQKKGWHY